MRSALPQELPVGLPDWTGLVGYTETSTRLFNLARRGHLPPFVLLEGRSGLGKRAFVAGFLAKLFCEQHTACGDCSDCRLLKVGRHDEVLWVDPDHAMIKLDDADAVRGHLVTQSGGGHYDAAESSYRVAVIIDAERLNAAATGRLLKTLEELPERSLVMMTSSNYRSIQDTIRSRAVRVQMRPPPPDVATKVVTDLLRNRGIEVRPELVAEALLRAGQSPGEALQLCEQLANESSLQKGVTRLLAAQTYGQVMDIAEELCRQQGHNLPSLVKEVEILLNRDYGKVLRAGLKARATHLTEIRQRRELLAMLRRYAVQHKIVLNAQLATEALGSLGIIQQ